MRRFAVSGVCLIGFVSLAAIADFRRATLSGSPRDAGQPQPPADLVLINGTVLTVNANDAVAQAVAIAAGKIVAVGTTEAIRSRAGSATRSSTCTAAPRRRA